MRIARYTLPAVCISIRREMRRLDSAVVFLGGGHLQCRWPPFRPRIAFSALTTGAARDSSHSPFAHHGEYILNQNTPSFHSYLRPLNSCCLFCGGLLCGIVEFDHGKQMQILGLEHLGKRGRHRARNSSPNEVSVSNSPRASPSMQRSRLRPSQKWSAAATIPTRCG